MSTTRDSVGTGNATAAEPARVSSGTDPLGLPSRGAFAVEADLDPGWVIWITGLAGAGKTTLSREVQGKLREQSRTVVGLDSDDLRAALGGDLGYSLEDRLRNAGRVCRMAQLLAAQGNDVVVSTISLFHQCHQWNRTHNRKYLEVLLQPDRSVLTARNQKGLMEEGAREVMGVDQVPELPEAPDLVLDSSGDVPLTDLASQVVEMLRG